MGTLAGALRSRTVLVTLAVAAALLLAPQLAPNNTWVRILILALIYVVLASGLNVVVGFTGLLDLGYIAFYAVGAYYTSILTVRVLIEGFGFTAADLWWLFFVNLVVAGFVAAVAGILLGYPTLRVRGDYLAIMTLGFGEIVRILATNLSGLTNGVAGIRGVPLPAIDGFRLSDPSSLYYLGLAIAVVALLTIARLARSYIGRAWVALREDELVAEVMGVQPARYKLLAYSTGAFYAGMIGVFFAHLQQFTNPQSFTLFENVQVLALVILGGTGTLWGPALGAIVWTLTSGWALQLPIVQEHPEFRNMGLGLLILVLVILFPRGLLGRFRPALVMRRAAEAAGVDVPSIVAGEPSPLEASPEQGAATEVIAIATALPAEGTLDATLPTHPAATPGDDGVLLRCEAVSRSFGGIKALKPTTLEVRRGEILGVIGPNGAGKTTLFNVITGVVPAMSGHVILRGTTIRRLRASDLARLGVSRTFQNIRLFRDMTVLENVMLAAHTRVATNLIAVVLGRRGTRELEQRALGEAQRVLAYVGLSGFEASIAGSLPYGHQRRVEIARALMVEPDILFLDEPAAGMNPTETNALADLIRRIRGDGVTIVLIEHDMQLLMEVSDRVVAFDQGELIAEGSPAEVRMTPAVIEAYLGPEAA